MSNKNDSKHVPVHEVRQTAKEVKKANHEVKQKSQGDRVVKWIFIALLVLAILYMIWTVTVVA